MMNCDYMKNPYNSSKEIFKRGDDLESKLHLVLDKRPDTEPGGDIAEQYGACMDNIIGGCIRDRLHTVTIIIIGPDGSDRSCDSGIQTVADLVR